ncbi:MAG TPA: hypothetical protein VJH37_02210 [Candidatus Nanoarchaeia archaeon]|nr:hypothetical protein [Candidatus Nanoarchaeia archaeon]
MKESHDPNRQIEILTGTMHPDLVEIYDPQQERERKYVVMHP